MLQNKFQKYQKTEKGLLVIKKSQKTYYEKNKNAICAKQKLKHNSRRVYLPLCEQEFKNKKTLKEYITTLKSQLVKEKIFPKHPLYNFCLDLLQRLNPDITDVYCFKFKSHSNKSPPDVQIYGTEPYRPYYKLTEHSEYQLFSVMKCIKGKPDTYRSKIMTALRWDIRSQIKEFIEETKTEPCFQCKKVCNKFDIDHSKLTFVHIAEKFLAKYDEPLETVSNDILKTLKDDEQRLAWQRYHKRKAKLQKLCIACHKEKTQKDRENAFGRH